MPPRLWFAAADATTRNTAEPPRFARLSSRRRRHRPLPAKVRAFASTSTIADRMIRFYGASTYLTMRYAATAAFGLPLSTDE